MMKLSTIELDELAFVCWCAAYANCEPDDAARQDWSTTPEAAKNYWRAGVTAVLCQLGLSRPGEKPTQIEEQS